jgi:uncharacterized protein with NRDE domain
LESSKAPEDFLNDLVALRDEFEGFNLICGYKDNVWYYGNKDPDNCPKKLSAKNVNSVSNNLLDSNWVKVIRGKEKLRDFIFNSSADLKSNAAQLFEILCDDRPVPDDLVQQTMWGFETERNMAPIFVKPFVPLKDVQGLDRPFGTRAQYVFMIDSEDHATLFERFRIGDGSWTSNQFEFDITESI